MKYKAGNRVKIKSIDWYNANKNYEGEIIYEDFRVFDEPMSNFCGEIVTIAHVNEKGEYYDIEEDGLVNYWTDEMIECLVYESQEKMVSLEDVCKFLDEHLYTGTSTGDYDYGQEYIYSDFDNALDLIFALRKAMEK